MRLFVDLPIQIGKELQLDSFSSNYLARVLRLKLNDQFYLFNGKSPLGEYLAQINQISKKNVSVQIVSFHPKDIESPNIACK